MSQVLDTACGHPWSEHGIEEVCVDLIYEPADDPRLCPCTRTPLDALDELRAERDAAQADVARLRKRTHELQERHDKDTAALRKRVARLVAEHGATIRAERAVRAAADMTMDELIEQLADAEHASWARWMDYLFSKSTTNPDGHVCIPPGLVERWKRQVETSYADLSEQEKESDRNEVRKILPIIEAFLAQRDPSVRDMESIASGHQVDERSHDAQP